MRYQLFFWGQKWPSKLMKPPDIRTRLGNREEFQSPLKWQINSISLVKKKAPLSTRISRLEFLLQVQKRTISWVSGWLRPFSKIGRRKERNTTVSPNCSSRQTMEVCWWPVPQLPADIPFAERAEWIRTRLSYVYLGWTECSNEA